MSSAIRVSFLAWIFLAIGCAGSPRSTPTETTPSATAPGATAPATSPATAPAPANAAALTTPAAASQTLTTAPSITPIRLAVDPTVVVGRIDEKIYGQFLEHIYHSVNGGLYGEIVWNRSFEFRPQKTPATRPLDPTTPLNGIASYWTAVGTGIVRCSTDNPLNSANCLQIDPATGPAGVTQQSIALKKNENYRGSIWARGKGSVMVRFAGEAKTLAQTTIGPVNETWCEYPLLLSPTDDADNAMLEITVTGGVTCIDQVSLMADTVRANGALRPDLLQAIADLRPPLIRWPGGSFANRYRWKSGIGPQEKRVSVPAPMWDDLDCNSFGTDEFIALCRRVNSEPVICVNINNQDLSQRNAFCQEAADWVEYCNGPAESKWGAVRAANGHAEPYNVKYWEIDNEVWKLDPADYVAIVRQFSAAMKKIDPTITIIACGSGQLGNRWGKGDEAVISDASDLASYLSVHHYENAKNYAKGSANDEAFFKKLSEKIAQSKNPDLKLFVSEWNLQSTDWRTGLYAGAILNAFERNPVVGMATPALFLRHVSATKWDNAFINFDHRTWFGAPNYVVMKLYREHYLPCRVDVTGNPADLHVTASRDVAGDRLVLKLVNPTEKPASLAVSLAGAFVPGKSTLNLIAPGSLDARNTLTNPTAVHATAGQVQTDGQVVRFDLPALSVGVVDVERAKVAKSPLVDNSPAHEARIAWWREARFGMFIHWGLYAIPAGEWNGQRISGNVEWIQSRARIPRDEYAKLAGQFNPTKFDADAWVQLAKDAGMKYLVLVAKHHDGFAMYGSKVDPFNIVDATAFKRDPARELSQACAKHGIRFCVYYSHNLDWHDPNTPASADKGPGSDRDYGKYLRDKAMPQVRELLSNYGPLGLVWFDMAGGMTREQAQPFADLVRSLQPDCLFNSRLSKGLVPADYLTTGDHSIPNRVGTDDWETPDTLNDYWGYRKNDDTWKSPGQVIFRLVDVASKGGNYLLNVGPTAEGIIPPQSVQTLQAVGAWMKTNGESIYGTGPTCFGAELGAPSATEKDPRTGKAVFVIARDWRCTTKPGIIYLHLFTWPKDAFVVEGVKAQVKRAFLLADPLRTPLKFEQTGRRLSLQLPPAAPDATCSVICVECEPTSQQ